MDHRPIRRAAALRLLALLALLAGCTDFELRYLIQDFRVLAIRAVDGPEEFVDTLIIFDPDDLEALAELEGLDDLEDLDFAALADEVIFRIADPTIDYLIEPLFVDPAHPDGPFRLRARACPFDETLRCDDWPPELVVEVVRGIEGVTPEDLSFVFAPKGDFLNRAIQVDPFRGFGGLNLVLDIDIESPSGIIRAAKTVSMQPAELGELLGAPQPLQPNRNPRLCGVRVLGMPPLGRAPDGVWRELWRQRNYLGRCDGDTRPDRMVEWDEPLHVPAGSELVLRPVPPNESEGNLRAEEDRYFVLGFQDGQPALLPRIERLEVDIYVDGGRLNDDRAFTRSVFGAQISPEFTWTVPSTVGFYTLYVVVRDNRGGVVWMTRPLEVIRGGDSPAN